MTLFLVVQIFGVAIIQVGFNFINEYKYSAFLSVCSSVISAVGAYRIIYHEDGDLNTILIEQKRLGSLIGLCFNIIIIISFLHYLLHFG